MDGGDVSNKINKWLVNCEPPAVVVGEGGREEGRKEEGS
jgi:hypothetical protein